MVNAFVCLISARAEPICGDVQQQYASSPALTGLSLRWLEWNGTVTLLTEDEGSELKAEVSCSYPYIGIGIVRLDNREDVARAARRESPDSTDLQLVVGALSQQGTEYVERLLGDFAFVIWNCATHDLVAATDAFAVRKLYYAVQGDLIAFASRAELLVRAEAYDLQYLSELLAYCQPTRGSTVYRDVHAIPAGSVARLERGVLVLRQYWCARDHLPGSYEGVQAQEYALTVRDLLLRSIKLRLTGRPDTWAHLSGGLDSSSIVSGAQWLAVQGDIPCGLAGSITCVDTHGTGGDERAYSDEVVRSYEIHNEVLLDYTCWRDDKGGAPLLDQPSGGYPFYARERRTCELVRAAGGKVLLTGIGGDNLFTGNMLFFADWLVRGRVIQALREMTRRAALGRVSFWELAFQNALIPLLPSPLQRHLARRYGGAPHWIPPEVVSRYDLDSRASASRTYAGRCGQKYVDAMVEDVSLLPDTLGTGLPEESLDVRHPFLYRPLVEFALSIPPEQCVQPHARKWVLRQAMSGILPEKIRTRVGKGTTYGQLAWSLGMYRDRFAAMLKDPILAQLGCIDIKRLRGAFEAAHNQRDRREVVFSDIQYTLAFEAWLQARSGRRRGNN